MNSSQAAELFFTTKVSFEEIKGYIESDTTGSPAYAAYQVLRHCDDLQRNCEEYKNMTVPVEWAKSVIANAKCGNPAKIASLMLENKFCSLEWAMEVVANAKCGDPASIAMEFVRCYAADRGWAESVIKNAMDGGYYWQVDTGIAQF